MRYAEACEWLQLDASANELIDEGDLRRAFRLAAIREHPDKSTLPDATSRFQKVTHAHKYLLRCVARGEKFEEDEDDGGDFFDFDEDYDDDDDFGVIFSFFRGPGGVVGIRIHFGNSDGFGSSEHPFRGTQQQPTDPFVASYEKYSGTSELKEERRQEIEQAYLERKRLQEEREYEEYMAQMYLHTKEREEERKRQKAQAEQHARTMSAQAERATREGRDFFESWTKKQCIEEAKRRGLKIKGLQHEEIVKLLIQDEAKKRTRRELKAKAPLVDEWAEVWDTKRAELNKKKVRVVDFYDDMYVVEWDATVGGKKSKVAKRESKKARIKPEHLRLWGSPETPAAASTTSVHAKSVSQKETEQEKETEQKSSSPPQKQAPKILKIKVKCPKDKKPGDIFEIKNPHAVGEKVIVTVPPKTEPGKSFPWFVRANEASKEPKKLVKKCSICTLDLMGDETAIELRSCPHLVCSVCIPLVDGKCCLSCGTPRPSNGSLQHLPYIQELQAPPAVLESILEEYFCRHESEAAKGTLKWRHAKEKLDHASEKATKAVNRHYRVTSLKVHPDRHGEEFRAQFEVLTKARDVLTDPELRNSYIDEMLEIVCKVDIGYLPRSHEVWIQKHDPEAVEQTRRKPEPGKKDKPLQLDGGIMFSKPKKAGVSILSNRERLIEVFLPVTNEHQFRSYCRGAVIVGSCGDMDDDHVRLGKISTENINLVRGYIPVKLYLPKHSVWDIVWYFLVDEGDGQLRDTPHSAEARVDLRPAKQFSLLKDIKTFDQLAKRRAGEIRSALRNHISLGPSPSRQETEARYWALHRDISNGRSLETKLGNMLKMAGDSSSPSLTQLHQILEEAALEKARLEGAYEGYIRRDARRSFKAKVAEFLEAGEANTWIQSVDNDELERFGGEANRLYQLLVEGKKANSLLLDGTTLLAAAKRSDLFSSKQCDTLKQRGDELEEQSTAEANRILEEAEKLEIEAQIVRDMEDMASLMPRGTVVKIQGLVSQKTLNGTLATFMGIGQNKRYLLRLFESNREVSLKQKNFSRWDESRFGESENKQGTASKTPPAGTTSVEKEKTSSSIGSSKPVGSQKNHAQKKEPIEAQAAPKQGFNAGQAHKNSPQRQGSVSKPLRNVDAEASHGSNSRKKTKKGPRCNMGTKCRFLRKGPNVCRFHHSPDEIAAVHHQHPPAEVTITVSPVEREISIEPAAIGHVLGEKGMHIRNVEDKSGALIKVQRDISLDGMCKVHISGSEEAVETAASMILEIAASARLRSSCTPMTLASSESTPPSLSLLSEQSSSELDFAASDQRVEPLLAGFRTPAKLPPVGLPPGLVTPSFVVQSPGDKLLAFLSKQKTCFKCSPDDFYRWLLSEDITSLNDIADAVLDESYLNSEMVTNGLKKFKRSAFSKSVIEALGQL